MRKCRMLPLFAALLAIVLAVAGTRALAATPGFTISASNATMSAGGSNSVAWTLTSVDGFSATIQVACNPASIPAGAHLPFCGGGGGPVTTYPLTANGVVQESFPLYATPPPCNGPCPVKFIRPQRRLASGLALAGVLLFGFGFVPRKRRWMALVLLAVGMLVGVTSCGGSSSRSTLTPGVWPYTMSAADTSTGENVSTTIDVTVQPGIVGNGLQ